MAASSSVWVWTWAISPYSIIASSVPGMPFLVAIQSPNSSIQCRSAAGGEMPVERGDADPASRAIARIDGWVPAETNTRVAAPGSWLRLRVASARSPRVSGSAKNGSRSGYGTVPLINGA